MPDNQPSFSSDFPTPDEAQWRSLVEKTLKGQPFEKAMLRKTRDGLIIDALGTEKCTVRKNQPNRPHGDWAIASPHWGVEPKAVNRDILVDLESGASALALTVGSDRHTGVASTDLAAALDGVYLDMVPVTLIQGEDFKAGVQAYEAVIGGRAYKKGDLAGSLGVDPIGTLARTGRLQITVEDAVADGAEIASRWSMVQPNVATFNADGTVFSNAGGSEAIEIAATISSAIVYLRAMEQVGLSLQTAAAQIQFTFSANADIWLTIAKFRAARRVWASVLFACGVKNSSMQINAVSAVYAVTHKDPWINVLRGTSACFAAALGGADVITTLPHDLFIGSSGSFSRRIARNIQIVLMEESNLSKVSDPAAGSFAIEKLTNDLAEISANLFASLEGSGGIIANLRSGALAETIADIAEKRSVDIRKRKIGIIGISEFPNIHEKSIENTGGGKAEEPATLPPAGEQVTALPLRRAAAEFEALRIKSDDILRQNGARPKIALINMGAAADFTARAAFSKNLFEAGGIEAIAGAGFDSIEEAVAAYSSSETPLAVICGTDQCYGDVGVELTHALKKAGCTRLYLAGKPENVNDLTNAGIDESIYMGCDAIASLERAYEALRSLGNGDVS